MGNRKCDNGCYIRRFTTAVIDITSLSGRWNAGFTRFYLNNAGRMPALPGQTSLRDVGTRALPAFILTMRAGCPRSQVYACVNPAARSRVACGFCQRRIASKRPQGNFVLSRVSLRPLALPQAAKRYHCQSKIKNQNSNNCPTGGLSFAGNQ